MVVRQSPDDLQRHLRNAIQALKISSEAYDKGFTGEAVRLAQTLRVLIHHTNESKSLLYQLGKQNMYFYDSSIPFDSNNKMPHMGILMMKMEVKDGVSKGSYEAPLDNGSPGHSRTKKLQYLSWWNDCVIIDSKKNKFRRRDLILYVANKDGGAHVSPELNQAYADLSRFNSLGWKAVSNGIEKPFEGAELACIRQIAHEVLKSLKEEYPEYFN